jgi:hypothetical protein
LKVGIIVDSLRLRRWQLEALRRLRGVDSFCVYDCRTPPPGRRRLRHGLYYLLNLFTVRNPLTRTVPLALDGPFETFAFEAGTEGMWQTLPPAVLDRIDADRPAVILKFGMNLLRIPERLRVPILSFHHGDPEHYRGRPAGFYELLNGEQVLGQIVQILSNRLDAGAVVGFAESRLYPHSYRATLMDAYRTSAFLLEPAIRNALSGGRVDKGVEGPVYRLPDSWTVVRFVARMVRFAFARLLYGAFFEKAWHVSTAPARADAEAGPAALPPAAAWKTVACPSGYTFLADPFFDGQGRLLVEALSARTRRGEILRLDGGGARRLLPVAHHVSYPGLAEEGGSDYCVPEMAESGTQRAFLLRGDANADGGRALDVAGSPRLMDPTLFRHEGRLYLFGNDLNEGGAPLRLWVGDSLFGRFEEHPESPVRLSPRGARMAGAVLAAGGALYRFGQDMTRDYGDGLVAFRVDALAPDRYREVEVGRLRFGDRKGPHTLNFHGDEAVFDWYRDRFSPFAGLRRVKQSRA